MEIKSKFRRATGGYTTTPQHWMPATGTRALIMGDTGLLWLDCHGEKYGFGEDVDEYSFLSFISGKGHGFENKWVRECAPEAVQILNDDRDVRYAAHFSRTLDALEAQLPVITKAPLWWAEASAYGTADLIAHSTWFYEQFPHLQIDKDEPTHYLILDCKFTSGLDTSEKALDLELAATQVTLYSYMLGHLQDYMPSYAYLVTRDRPLDPLPVAIEQKLGEPLDTKLTWMRDRYLHIKLAGAQYRPWRDKIVALNPANGKDAPWSRTKKLILEHLVPGRPLEFLPGVGERQACELNALGYHCLEDLLKAEPHEIPFDQVYGFGPEKAAIAHAILQANRTNKATKIPSHIVPPRRKIEMYVDYEFLTNVNVDFESQWPEMRGCEMVFMVGCGWIVEGDWHFKTFVAEEENHVSERRMLKEFLAFLDEMGVFAEDTSALYHYTNAESQQSDQAAERHKLPRLKQLPWCNLHSAIHQGRIALPGMWGHGLKEVAGALGEYDSRYRVEWPDKLGEGLSAMVAGFAAYQQADPLRSKEMEILTEYLEVDCRSMHQILQWLRGNRQRTVQSHQPVMGWYSAFKHKVAMESLSPCLCDWPEEWHER